MAKNLIIEGLKDAVRHARGDKSRGTAYTLLVDHPLDVKAIRVRMGLTQIAFANKYGFSLASLRNWEQRRRKPTGAYQNLLKLIDRIPDQVERVLERA
ncbi:MAG: transcriptional regulator [Rhodospirillales bacterium]|nr:transcriptional regulator [Rhodospirillales bacterium]